MKKEVNPNINEEISVASDAISHFMGADFMGVNEARPAFFDKNVEEKINERIEAGEFEDKASYDQPRKLNSSRIFDPTSYYDINLEKYPDTSYISFSFKIFNFLDEFFVSRSNSFSKTLLSSGNSGFLFDN